LNAFIAFRVIFVAAFISLALSPIGFWAARRLNLMDTPGSAPHKLHDAPVPIAGGVVLFLTILIVSGITGTLLAEPVSAILVASSVIFLFGLWDDARTLSPAWKLFGQIIASILLIYLGVQVRLFQQNWLNYALTVLWMVGVTNAFNFVDSMDGLALGLALLASAFFMLVTIDSQQLSLTTFSTILLGACLGTFFFNAAPAYFFLGDSGAQTLGFLLAALGIAYNPLGFSRLASWYVPILLLGVPIFDATLVIFSRWRRGKPIYKAARDHTFHRLVKLGISPNRAVLTMHMVALLAGCLAFIALDLPPLVANAVFGMVFLLAVGVLWYLDRQEFWEKDGV
jgi:UDP-GlcNAc:undecaprenyl-phosphate GlcNAc-1-phosphate transferase